MRYRVNLLPNKLQRNISIDVGKLVKRVVVTLAVVSLFTGYGIFLFNFYSTKKELAATEEKFKQVQVAVKKVEAIKKQRLDNEKAVNEFKELLKKRQTWACVLEDINYNLPTDMWLESIDIYCAERQVGPEQPAQENKTASGKQETDTGPEAEEQSAVPVPDTLAVAGYSRTVASVGVFVNNLNQMPYFSSALLVELFEDEKYMAVKKFRVSATIKEGGR